MRNQIRLVLCFSTLLTGCTFGFVPTNLEPAKPYLHYWDKSGMTIEGRRDDSWVCGAAHTVHAADFVVFSDEQRNAVRLPGDKNDFAPDTRLTRSWVECMKAKGYRYAK